MPVLAGWLTGEQVPPEIIEQTLTAMGGILERHGGETARSVQAGSGLIAFADTAYSMPQQKESAVLDWVPDRRTLVYRRPLTGAYPLFYIEDWPAPGNLLFASEIKALFAVGVPRCLHIAALEALRRHGFIPAPWTAFKDIHVVPAGSILRWQHTKTVVSPASDFSLVAPLPHEDLAANVQTLLKQAISSLQPSHDKIISLISGSSASSLVAAYLASHIQEPLSAAALGTSKMLATKAWKNVQRVTDMYDLSLLAITANSDPEGWNATLLGIEAPCRDTRSLAIYQLLHTAAQITGARIAFSGLGAQALLGLTTSDPLQPEREDWLTALRQPRMPAESISSQLWSGDVRQQLQKEEAWEETRHAQKLIRRARQFPDSLQSQHYLGLHLDLADRLMLPWQQLAIHESMVLRSPFLTPYVMETMVNSANLLQDKGILTALLQHEQLDIPAHPAILPLNIPAPTPEQICNTASIAHTLTPEAIRQTGIFNPQTVQMLLQQQAAHKAISADLLFIFTTQLLYTLFSIEGWS
ncbi:asparagine synthase-related protein [Dictyobacter arantiisoli]|uniref:asparagine synthase (glutamine-hydrolyzing) n=1 Tax=Dictyobacter arantiisoli TaxID=2014874 RepID=A0A5A5T8N7_9CHLR|nr:asparagine synthase-related protein [Dictyobacter arantiisoli]GCF07840.1 hypothetical protein KDI_14040 [Dictyobacter arantiisoli]